MTVNGSVQRRPGERKKKACLRDVSECEKKEVTRGKKRHGDDGTGAVAAVAAAGGSSAQERKKGRRSVVKYDERKVVREGERDKLEQRKERGNIRCGNIRLFTRKQRKERRKGAQKERLQRRTIVVKTVTTENRGEKNGAAGEREKMPGRAKSGRTGSGQSSVSTPSAESSVSSPLLPPKILT